VAGARGGNFANALFAQAAAWAPNPLNPPQFFDMPTKDLTNLAFNQLPP